MSEDAGGLPPALVEGFARLCEGDFSYRLPRTMARDQEDTAAFYFNAIAAELERIVGEAHDHERRLEQAVETMSAALLEVAAGNLDVEVERDFKGDSLDVLAFLVNNTVSELKKRVAESERRAEENRLELERLVAERTEQLQRSEENFRRLFEAAPVPMLLIEPRSGVVEFCNGRAAVLLDETEKSMVGRRSLEYFERREDAAVLLERLRAEGFVEAFAVRLRTRTGRAFWTLATARRINIEERELLMASFTDLTEQKRTEETLRELATTDPLTGIPNRRHFLELAADELARADRYDRPLCLAMLDLDHFKSVNDGYGHLTGDEALRMVARLVKGQLRRQDTVARYGGEEFVILLPETTLEDAREVVDRSRVAVQNGILYAGMERIRLTLSAGVVTWQEGEAIDQLVDRADAALYEAKQTGRNRVVA